LNVELRSLKPVCKRCPDRDELRATVDHDVTSITRAKAVHQLMENPDVKTLKTNYGKQPTGESFAENHNGKHLGKST